MRQTTHIPPLKHVWAAWHWGIRCKLDGGTEASEGEEADPANKGTNHEVEAKAAHESFYV
jgi:hypothetical protein